MEWKHVIIWLPDQFTSQKYHKCTTLTNCHNLQHIRFTQICSHFHIADNEINSQDFNHKSIEILCFVELKGPKSKVQNQVLTGEVKFV
jgi:hypothetical protein